MAKNKKDRGFSLIEVLISLGIFLYIFSALFSGLSVLKNNFLKQGKSANCTRTTMTLLIKRLTNSVRVYVGSTTSSIYFKYLNGDINSLILQGNQMYLNSDQVHDLPMDNCEVKQLELDQKSKCLTLIYLPFKTSTSSRSETVCALK